MMPQILELTFASGRVFRNTIGTPDLTGPEGLSSDKLELYGYDVQRALAAMGFCSVAEVALFFSAHEELRLDTGAPAAMGLISAINHSLLLTSSQELSSEEQWVTTLSMSVDVRKSFQVTPKIQAREFLDPYITGLYRYLTNESVSAREHARTHQRAVAGTAVEIEDILFRWMLRNLDESQLVDARSLMVPRQQVFFDICKRRISQEGLLLAGQDICYS